MQPHFTTGLRDMQALFRGLNRHCGKNNLSFNLFTIADQLLYHFIVIEYGNIKYQELLPNIAFQ